MKKYGLLILFVLMLALAACGGSPTADSAGQPGGVSAQATATPAPTATPDPLLMAAPVGGYDSCTNPLDWGRVAEAYELKSSPTGYAATVQTRTWTREAGPRDFDECYKNRNGQYIFTKHDVPITKEAYDRLTGVRNDLTIMPPAYWGQVPTGWENAGWIHDYFNGLTAEEVQEIVNTSGPALLLVGSLAAVGLLSAAIIPPVIGAPLAPDCAYNSCG